MTRNDVFILADCIGGSVLYGLNNENSDLDYRYVYIPRSKSKILGLDLGNKEVITEKKTEKDDAVGYELRHFMRQLRKQTTSALEILFSTETKGHYYSWLNIRDHRHEFMDSKKFFHSLLGYMEGELRLAIGERTGQLGGKRKEALEKYGFSPKNFVQLLRLCYVGSHFFATGNYVVKISDISEPTKDGLMEIKNHPENFTKQELIDVFLECKKAFESEFENRARNFEFNEELCNDLCFDAYKRVVNEA